MDPIYQLKYLCSVVLHLRDVYVLVSQMKVTLQEWDPYVFYFRVWDRVVIFFGKVLQPGVCMYEATSKPLCCTLHLVLNTAL